MTGFGAIVYLRLRPLRSAMVDDNGLEEVNGVIGAMVRLAERSFVY